MSSERPRITLDSISAKRIETTLGGVARSVNSSKHNLVRSATLEGAIGGVELQSQGQCGQSAPQTEFEEESDWNLIRLSSERSPT